MFDFLYLNKEHKNEYLPILFDLLYSNMKDIAPQNFEKTEFVREVSMALEKEPRQIILIYNGEELAGFMMYYTRNELLMIEELQLAKKYQRTRALYLLCRYMMKILPENIEYIEAFAHNTNTVSLSLQEYLGMEIVENVNEGLLHLRGNAKAFKNKIR